MTTEEIYLEVLQKLLDFTRNGKIKWNRQNLSTLYFEQSTKNGQIAIMSIQRISIMGRFDYILTIKNTFRNEINLIIDTAKEFNYRDHVAELYKSALVSVENDGLSFLSDLMDSIQ